jgi:hypothetical protein
MNADDKRAHCFEDALHACRLLVAAYEADRALVDAADGDLQDAYDAAVAALDLADEIEESDE